MCVSVRGEYACVGGWGSKCPSVWCACLVSVTTYIMIFLHMSTCQNPILCYLYWNCVTVDSISCRFPFIYLYFTSGIYAVW
jgi:hypothetical protein